MGSLLFFKILIIYNFIYQIDELRVVLTPNLVILEDVQLFFFCVVKLNKYKLAMRGLSRSFLRDLEKTTKPTNIKRKIFFFLSSLTFSSMIYCDYGNQAKCQVCHIDSESEVNGNIQILTFRPYFGVVWLKEGEIKHQRKFKSTRGNAKGMYQLIDS